MKDERIEIRKQFVSVSKCFITILSYIILLTIQSSRKSCCDMLASISLLLIKDRNMKVKHHKSVKEEEWLVFIHHLSGQYFENQDDKNDGSFKKSHVNWTECYNSGLPVKNGPI